MTEITGPHGTREGKPFYFIHQEPESDRLGSYLQYVYWRMNGYQIFMTCLGGYLIAWPS